MGAKLISTEEFQIDMSNPTQSPVPALSPAVRYEWGEYAKGIGIFLVVVAHNLGGLANAGMHVPPAVQGLIDYAYSFHMPLFFLLSGLFAEQSFKKGFKPFMSGKMRTVMYPFLLWSLIQGGVIAVLGRYTNHPMGFGEVLKQMFVNPPSQMWFLYALFWMFLFYGIWRSFGLKPEGIVIPSILFWLCSSLVHAPFLHKVLLEFIFFGLGIVLRTSIHPFLKQFKPMSAAAVAGLVFIVHWLCLFALPMGFRSSFTFLPIALLGITSVALISAALAELDTAHLIKVLGHYSLVIFLMHTLFGSGARIVLQHFLHNNNVWLHIFAGLIGGIVFPLGIAILAEHRKAQWLFQWPVPKRAVTPVTA